MRSLIMTFLCLCAVIPPAWGEPCTLSLEVEVIESALPPAIDPYESEDSRVLEGPLALPSTEYLESLDELTRSEWEQVIEHRVREIRRHAVSPNLQNLVRVRLRNHGSESVSVLLPPNGKSSWHSPEYFWQVESSDSSWGPVAQGFCGTDIAPTGPPMAELAPGESRPVQLDSLRLERPGRFKVQAGYRSPKQELLDQIDAKRWNHQQFRDGKGDRYDQWLQAFAASVETTQACDVLSEPVWIDLEEASAEMASWEPAVSR